MNILCKEKDYYDYVGYQNGSEDVIFDRRNFYLFENSENVANDTFKVYPKCTEKQLAQRILEDKHFTFDRYMLALQAGYNVYVFRLQDIISGDVEFEYIGMRKCYELKFNLPLGFHKLDVCNFGRMVWKDYKQLWSLRKSGKEKNFELESFLQGNPANWKFKPLFADSYEEVNDIPILKSTFVPKYIDAQEIYCAIEEWLIAQHNDVDQESKGLTDVDKVVNHGFDKKSSFRNVK